MGLLDKWFMGHHSGGRHGRTGHHGYAGSDGDPAMRCASCGAENTMTARFCQRCGAPLAPAACTQCAAPLSPGARFCAGCGKPVGGTN
ncbi:zinc ribbon domain-containing protein [Comamonas flocculans]|uniref:Zinc-ribbon domain-containing protein n=1 Tax=Comamonas flocculans TaxID=2597701 RepID=A0A5B8RU68_9BURK|nr:zinc-ribbon domain-containing protein [Comamonas flocculans]